MSYHDEYDDVKSHTSWTNEFLEEPRQAETKILSLIEGEYSSSAEFRILDLGCGDGSFTKHLARNFPNAEVHGFDPARKLIASLRKSCNNITWRQFDALNPALVDSLRNYFDCIVVSAVTQVLSSDEMSAGSALDKIEEFYKTVKALAKPETGLIINFDGYHDYPEYKLISHSWESDQSYADAELADSSRLKQCTYSYPSVKWLREMMLRLGFERIDVYPFYLTNCTIDCNHEPGKTFTKRSISGNTLSMLGLVEQPWKHVVAYTGKASRKDV